MYYSLLAYCTARFGRSDFSLLDATAPTDAFRTLTAEVGTMSGNRSINFAEIPTSTVQLGIFYMPQICDMGPTALLPFRRKACLRIFYQIRRLRSGLSPRTWVPEASTLTPRPPKPLRTGLHGWVKSCPWGIHSSNRPACSDSLYRLCYSALQDLLNTHFNTIFSCKSRSSK
jgi:hypothetical protein